MTTEVKVVIYSVCFHRSLSTLCRVYMAGGEPQNDFHYMQVDKMTLYLMLSPCVILRKLYLLYTLMNLALATFRRYSSIKEALSIASDIHEQWHSSIFIRN